MPESCFSIELEKQLTLFFERDRFFNHENQLPNSLVDVRNNNNYVGNAF